MTTKKNLFISIFYFFVSEIVIFVGNRLEFYDSHGRRTHTEHITFDGICRSITYDPIHNRVLFTESNEDTFKSNIYSFEIDRRTIDCLVRNTTYITNMSYDLATELLFWVEDMKNMYSISLKPGCNNSVNEKHLILSDESNLIETIAVDSCGRYVINSLTNIIVICSY